MEVVSAPKDVINPATIDDDPSQAYTIIRVKRKLVSTSSNERDDNSAIPGYNASFKRLRHLGSFTAPSASASASASTSTSAPPDEEAIRRNSLLKMGLSGQKRVRFSDLNQEQFSAYVETLGEKNEENRKKRKVLKKAVTFEQKEKDEKEEDQKTASDEGSGDLFSIGLTQADFASPKEEEEEDKKSKNSSNTTVTTTCNGAVLEEVSSSSPSSQKDFEKDPQYVYDYYLMVDYVLSFEETKHQKEGTEGDEVWDADSNDENYRYNDYPDEDEFDSEGDSSSSRSATNFGFVGSNSEDEDGDGDGREAHLRDIDSDQEDYLGEGGGRQYYDEEEEEDDEWIRDMERRMRRAKITDDDDDDDQDSSASDFD